MLRPCGRQARWPGWRSLEFGQLTDAWKGEAADFTPLLAEQLDAIGAAIGLDLASIGQSEVHTTGGRRIDIVAQDADVTVMKSSTPKIAATPPAANTASANRSPAAASALVTLTITGSVVSNVNFMASGFGVGEGEAWTTPRSYASSALGHVDAICCRL